MRLHFWTAAAGFAASALMINAYAENSTMELMDRLNAKEILGVSPLKGRSVGFPTVVRYTKKGDAAPGCVLIVGAGDQGVIDLVSPEPGTDLPACGSGLKAPIQFEQKGRYLLYEYSVEDPRKDFTPAFQLLSYRGSSYGICKNDRQITALAMRYRSNIGVKRAFVSAVKKVGCK
jgi:hypothetical protein